MITARLGMINGGIFKFPIGCNFQLKMQIAIGDEWVNVRLTQRVAMAEAV